MYANLLAPMRRFLSALLLSFATVGFLGGSAYAVEAGSGQALEIAPPLVNLRADPGETVTADIKIRDIAKEPLVVSSTINDFGSEGETGAPKIDVDGEEPSAYSLIPWVQPLPELTLEPGQIKDLPVEINVPANASPGGYYGVIRFTARPGSLDESGVALSASVGALVFLRVNGEAQESMEIEELYASKQGRRSWFFDSKPILFTQRIKNTGNVQQQPVSILAITDMFGNNIANLSFNLERRNVLPDSIRRFDSPLDESNIGNRLLFGIYTAQLTTNYGPNNELVVTDSIRIFVFPWRLVLGVIVALAVVIGGFRIWLSRRDQKASSGRRYRRR